VSTRRFRVSSRRARRPRQRYMRARSTGDRGLHRGPQGQLSEARIQRTRGLHLTAALPLQLRRRACLRGLGRRPIGRSGPRPPPRVRHTNARQGVGGRHVDRSRNGRRQAYLQPQPSGRNATRSRPSLLPLLCEVQGFAECVAPPPWAQRLRRMV